MQRAVTGLLAAVLAVLPVLSAPPAAADEGEVTLPLARYEALMNAARQSHGATVTWSRGSVDVTLPGADGTTATVTVSASLQVVGDTPASVPLLPADVILQSASIGGSDASFTTHSGVLVATVDTNSRVSVQLTYLVPVTGGGSGSRGAVIPLPHMPGASLDLEGPSADGRIDVWPAADVSRSGTSLEASVPATAGLGVSWGAGGGDFAIRRMDLEITPDAEGEGADVTARYEVHLTGARATFRIAPEGAALIDVRDGKGALAASVGDDGHLATVVGRGRHEVEARFRVRIDRSQGQPEVGLGVLEVPITRVEVSVAGTRDITFEPEAPATVSVSGDGDRARTRAVAHMPPTEEVTVRWTETRAAPEELVRVNAATYQLVTLHEAVMRSRVIIRYEVIRGNVKELPIAIPEQAVLYKVNGEGVDDWKTFARDDQRPRHARVFLGSDVDGEYTLELELESVVSTTEGTPLTLPVIQPLDTTRQRGVVALFEGDKVAFAPAEAAGYTKVGEDALPVEIRTTLTDKVSQAFKHIGEPGPITSTVATAKERDVRFDAHVHTLYTVKEGALLGNASVQVEIKSGRRDFLMLNLPESVSVLNVTAPSLNKAEPAPDHDAGEQRKGHKIAFTRALEGAIQLDVEFEMLLPKELGTIELPTVRVEGAEVEDGAFGITAEAGIEVQGGEETDVRKVEARELPRSVRGRTDRQIPLAYTYARAPWALKIAVTRHKTVETLRAVVSHMWIATTILEDGKLVTHATLDIANEGGGGRFFRLALPEGHNVWTVAADGVAVKAVADESGALTLPLPRGKVGRVDVIYEVRREELSFTGRVDLVAPQVDLLTTDIKWLVRTPARVSLYGIDTDLSDAETYLWHGSYSQTAGLNIPFSISANEPPREFLYSYAAHDPKEDALAVSFGFVSTPGEDLGPLLWLFGILLLIPAVVRRASHRAMGATSLIALVGLVMVVAKLVGWGFGAGDVIMLLVLIVAPFIAYWRSRRSEEASA